MKQLTQILTLLLLNVTISLAGSHPSGKVTTGGCSANYSYSSMGAWLQFNAGTSDSSWVYTWDFGDGNTGSGSVGYNYYAASGTYYVCLAVVDSANNCTDTFCDSVTVVVPVCNSTFTYSTDSSGAYTFQAQPVTQGWQYYWDLGDGGFEQGDSINYNFQQSGSFTVCLYTSDTINGCNSTYCDTLDIFVPVNCSATFFAVPLTGSASFIVQGMNPGMTYTFNFGDSTTGTPNGFGFATHNYATGGTYVVCLNVVDSASGCTSSFCDTVMIPSCNISADFVVTNLPNGRIFVDALQSGFQFQYSWMILPAPDDTLVSAFGRDTLTHQFTTNGIKSVCLRIQDFVSTTCADTVCKFVNISGIGIEEQIALENSFALYPNPAKDNLIIRFELKAVATVTCEITDLTGKTVFRSIEGSYPAGLHSSNADISPLASGTYIIRLTAGDVKVNRRFTKN